MPGSMVFRPNHDRQKRRFGTYFITNSPLSVPRLWCRGRHYLQHLLHLVRVADALVSCGKMLSLPPFPSVIQRYDQHTFPLYILESRDQIRNGPNSLCGWLGRLWRGLCLRMSRQNSLNFPSVHTVAHRPTTNDPVRCAGRRCGERDRSGS